MSAWKFKNLTKAHDVVIFYFMDTNGPFWADTSSVTLPVADAQKLCEKLHATLHPRSK